MGGQSWSDALLKTEPMGGTASIFECNFHTMVSCTKPLGAFSQEACTSPMTLAASFFDRKAMVE